MPLERLRSRRWDGVGPGVNKLFTVAKPRYHGPCTASQYPFNTTDMILSAPQAR